LTLRRTKVVKIKRHR